MGTSTTIADACVSMGDEVARQGDFFDALPIELPLCKAARQIASTGKATSRDEARALAIAACKLAGLSDSETARRMGCSRNTIAPVIEQLERSGRIPSLQVRLQGKLGQVAESAADEIIRLIGEAQWNMDRAGAVRALGVTLGIATEKHLLLTGQPTAILEQRVGAPTADAVREWEEKLRQLFGPVIEVNSASPPDAQSAGVPPKCFSDRAALIFAPPFATLPPPARPHQVDPIAPGRGGDRHSRRGPSEAR